VDDPQQVRKGFLAALAAYGLWGLLPAFFVALDPSGPVEILGWRIALSLVFCLGILMFLRRVRVTLGLLKNPALRGLSAIAAALILVNWSVYVYSSLNAFIVEAALGYFINPLITVALGVVVLKEKLRPLQWVSLSLALAAVVVLAVGYGSVPVISLTLALSFGFYGFVKNRMGSSGEVGGQFDSRNPLVEPDCYWTTRVGGTGGGVDSWHFGGSSHGAVVGCGSSHEHPVTLFRSCSSAVTALHYGADAIHRPDHAVFFWGLYYGRAHAAREVAGICFGVVCFGPFER